MPTIAVDVADFTADERPTAGVVMQVARAAIDVSGSVIISTAITTIPLPGGTGTLTVEVGVVYWARFFGVEGFWDEWYFTAPADMSAADLYRDHRVDPATFAPLPTYPTVAATLAKLRGDLDLLAAEVGDASDPVTDSPVDHLPDLTVLFENGLI